MSLKAIGSILIIGLMFSVSSYSQGLYLSARGNSESESQVIDSITYQKTFNNFASLQQETIVIKNKLFNLGYLESELLGIKKQNDSTYLASFILNNRFHTIRLNFDETINRNILQLVFTTLNENYVDIKIDELEETLKKLNFEFSNLGDPFSTLQLSNIKRKDNTILYADLVVSEEIQKRTIDSIIINGYEKFPKSYVNRFLKIRRSQPFNLKTIKNKTSELYNLPFATQIKEPEVLFTKDSTLLYIYVEKQKSNAFDGFLGFSTNPESNKLEFNGYLNLNLVNNLNYGESFRVIYKSDENEQKTFDVKMRLPYLFGSPLGTELGLNIFKKDSTFVTVAQSAKLQYQIDSKNSISTGIESNTSTNLLDNASLFVDDYKSTFYTVNYSHINRQQYDPLFPINFQFDIYTGFGNRIFEESDQAQVKLHLDTYKIFNLNNKNSVFIRLTGALLNSDDYFDNELFRFGGINSLRGFEENSIAANLFSVLNTEYRYKVGSTLFIHTVLDGSYFENQTIDIKEKLFGFGFGFGLLTKAGLFKFTYASGKTENQPFKLADFKIHLSLNASF